MIINKMIKIIKMLFDSYVYISSIICPYIIYNEDRILNYINTEYKLTHYNDDIKYNKDFQRYNNNYKIIMSSNNYNYKKNNNKLIKRSQNTDIIFKNCNWCNNNIDSTNQITYHYMDNIYCDIKCRNKQIEKDTINTIKIINK